MHPDIAFTRVHLAVFVDGCFWHGCPEHGHRPKVKNGHYWGPKIARNVERDLEQTQALTASGWTVLRFWEHEAPDTIARSVRQSYRQLMRLGSKSLEPVTQPDDSSLLE